MTPERRAESFLKTNPLKNLIGIPPEVISACSRTAFDLFQQQRWDESAVMCQGLLAADPGDVYAHRLLAGALLRTGQLSEALAQVDRGLEEAPKDGGLQQSRTAILEAIRLFAALREPANKLATENTNAVVSSSTEVQ